MYYQVDAYISLCLVWHSPVSFIAVWCVVGHGTGVLHVFIILSELFSLSLLNYISHSALLFPPREIIPMSLWIFARAVFLFLVEFLKRNFPGKMAHFFIQTKFGKEQVFSPHSFFLLFKSSAASSHWKRTGNMELILPLLCVFFFIFPLLLWNIYFFQLIFWQSFAFHRFTVISYMTNCGPE